MAHDAEHGCAEGEPNPLLGDHEPPQPLGPPGRLRWVCGASAGLPVPLEEIPGPPGADPDEPARPGPARSVDQPDRPADPSDQVDRSWPGNPGDHPDRVRSVDVPADRAWSADPPPDLVHSADAADHAGRPGRPASPGHPGTPDHSASFGRAADGSGGAVGSVETDPASGAAEPGLAGERSRLIPRPRSAEPEVVDDPEPVNWSAGTRPAGRGGAGTPGGVSGPPAPDGSAGSSSRPVSSGGEPDRRIGSPDGSAGALDDEGQRDRRKPSCRTDRPGWAGAHRHGAVRPTRRAVRRDRPPRRWC